MRGKPGLNFVRNITVVQYSTAVYEIKYHSVHHFEINSDSDNLNKLRKKIEPLNTILQSVGRQMYCIVLPYTVPIDELKSK